MEAQEERAQAAEDDGEATPSEDDQEPRLEDAAEAAPWVESQREISQREEVDEEDATSEDDQGPEAAPGMEAQGELPLCHQVEKTHKKSFIDDLTLLEKIYLKNFVKEETFIGPPSFHGRFKLPMPPKKFIL